MEAIKLCRLDTPIIFIEARINLSRFVVIFFFHAEDGIRAGTVTGVQSCALPIYHGWLSLTVPRGVLGRPPGPSGPGVPGRAEERSGGEEQRQRRSTPSYGTI